MGRYKYRNWGPRDFRWTFQGFHRLPVNGSYVENHGDGRSVETYKKHPRYNRWYYFGEWPQYSRSDIIKDYIGRRHPRVLRHYQWKKRKELVKFYDRAKETNHALGNVDWMKELASYV